MAARIRGGGARRRSYAWARHLEASEVDYQELSRGARAGFEHALLLAEDSKRRSLDPRRDKKLPPLTVEEIAADEELPVAMIKRRIEQARRQLFGELSDQAIYKRCQRVRARPGRRVCAQEGCDQPIPQACAGNRRYCLEHASGRERVRRHRQAHEPASQSRRMAVMMREWTERGNKPHRQQGPGLCYCGCGTPLGRRRPTARYLNGAHRQRAYRRRKSWRPFTNIKPKPRQNNSRRHLGSPD